jgi:hypothetical protein
LALLPFKELDALLHLNGLAGLGPNWVRVHPRQNAAFETAGTANFAYKLIKRTFWWLRRGKFEG